MRKESEKANSAAVVKNGVLTVDNCMYLFPLLQDRKVKVQRDLKKFTKLTTEAVDPGAPLIAQSLTQELAKINFIIDALAKIVRP